MGNDNFYVQSGLEMDYDYGNQNIVVPNVYNKGFNDNFGPKLLHSKK